MSDNAVSRDLAAKPFCRACPRRRFVEPKVADVYDAQSRGHRAVMMSFWVPLAVLASIYWTVRELALNTFKAASRRKPFIIGFALAGLTIAVADVVVREFLFRTLVSTTWFSVTGQIL